MLLLNRVIFKDDAVIVDYSRELSDYNTGTLPMVIVPADDAIYIGSDLPFNHRHFCMSALNAVAGSVTVAIWSGTAFLPAVDVIDLTAVAGAPLARDGMIMWTTDKSAGWSRAGTTEDVPQLAAFKIYDCFWVKITFSAAVAATIKYVGHKFAKDSDLNAYYGDLNRAAVREAFFEAVTPDWNDVHISAAEEIVRDLRTQKVARSPNQIFDPDTFRDAGCHKLAEIVYSSFGPSHADRLEYAVRKYKEAMNKLVFGVDKNEDGKLTEPEKVRDFRLRRR